MSNLTFNFTKTKIDTLPPTIDTKCIYYRDTQLKGLTLAVQRGGAKSFYLYKKINGKPERLFVGKYPDLSVENARKLGSIKLGLIAQGINPADEKRKAKHETTLGQLYHQYMNRYSKVHKKSWIYDEREIPKFFNHWFKRKLKDIKRPEVQNLHDYLFETVGRYQANRCLERLRAMYNKAIEWGWEGTNPTNGIKKFKEKSRDRFVQPSEMPFLLQSIIEEPNETIRDFIWLLLLTGARKTNTLMMRYEQLEWELNLWRIPETKNGEPQTITLTDRAVEILKTRLVTAKSEWVYPQDDDPSKHLVKHDRGWKRILERATVAMWQQHPQVSKWVNDKLLSYVSHYNSISQYNWLRKISLEEEIDLPTGLMDIRLHDLRRTFGSYQALTGASLQIIGKSLGHKSTHATLVYARLNLDAVKSSIDKATEAMFAIS
ncbi:tyrosine-type recombinase/integrase [Mucilaginibacter terrae]|uniref:tyrosine-type recombinase/integrase n=1 Tax=Mucilaginibacter terrae TaxID=1955052 RepID=UPI00363DF292